MVLFIAKGAVKLDCNSHIDSQDCEIPHASKLPIMLINLAIAKCRRPSSESWDSSDGSKSFQRVGRSGRNLSDSISGWVQCAVPRGMPRDLGKETSDNDTWFSGSALSLENMAAKDLFPKGKLHLNYHERRMQLHLWRMKTRYESPCWAAMFWKPFNERKMTCENNAKGIREWRVSVASWRTKLV